MTTAMSMPGSFFPPHDHVSSSPFATPSFSIVRTPSAASVLTNSFQTFSRNHNASASNSRKRPRVQTQTSDAVTHRSTRSFRDDEEPSSPAPLANTEYRLAGGLDTPCAERIEMDERGDLEYEQDLRMNRYNVHNWQSNNSYFPATPSSDDVRCRKRKFPSSPGAGWGRVVWDATGGMAGRVINFCINTAFHGFHAGGGQGFNMQIDTPTVTAAAPDGTKSAQDVFHAGYKGRSSTPVPGEFPADDDMMYQLTRRAPLQPFDTPTQTLGADRSSLRSNWVMVNEPYSDRDTSPVRKRSRPSTANLHSRPATHQSFSSRPRLTPRSSTGGASVASTRASLPTQPTSVHLPPATESERRHKRMSSSLASPRSSGVRQSEASSKSPEVVRFEKRVRRQGQRQDESIQRMNEKLQYMMKELHQTLSSKVEVYEDTEDEGYGEGTDRTSNDAW